MSWVGGLIYGTLSAPPWPWSLSQEPGQAANSEIHGLKTSLARKPNPARLTSELENSLLGPLLISTHKHPVRQHHITNSEIALSLVLTIGRDG